MEKEPKFAKEFTGKEFWLYGVLYPLGIIVMCGIAEFINQL